MDEQFDVCQNGQQYMENPLLWPILEILRKQPTSWKVHTLAQELSEHDYIPQLDPSPDKDLFKRNFLLMNALYQLQETLYPDGWLQVEAMNIVLMSAIEASRHSIDINDPLREYYLDWKNYEPMKARYVDSSMIFGVDINATLVETLLAIWTERRR